jgi:NAD(P)-dependent dehydrogenase (short-subunit alcohol dehydrogenase family)
MAKLKDKVALITGGARRVGAAQTLNVDGGDWMS